MAVFNPILEQDGPFYINYKLFFYPFTLLINQIMKSIILIVIYFVSYMFFFLLLSTVGVFFDSYIEVITSNGWFMAYSLFLGWWLAIFPAREYYVHHEEYFEKVF